MFLGVSGIELWEQGTPGSVIRLKGVHLSGILWHFLLGNNAKLLSLAGENRTNPDLKCRGALVLFPFPAFLCVIPNRDLLVLWSHLLPCEFSREELVTVRFLICNLSFRGHSYDKGQGYMLTQRDTQVSCLLPSLHHPAPYCPQSSVFGLFLFWWGCRNRKAEYTILYRMSAMTPLPAMRSKRSLQRNGYFTLILKKPL